MWIDLPKAFTQDLTNAGTGLNSGLGLGGATNFSGRSSANGSEDGVTSTATNSLPHGTHRELPTVCKGYSSIYLLVYFCFICGVIKSTCRSHSNSNAHISNNIHTYACM